MTTLIAIAFVAGFAGGPSSIATHDFPSHEVCTAIAPNLCETYREQQKNDGNEKARMLALCVTK